MSENTEEVTLKYFETNEQEDDNDAATIGEPGEDFTDERCGF